MKIFRKSINILLHVNEVKTITELAKYEVSLMYAYRVIRELARQDLVYAERTGRNSHVELTQKGKSVVMYIKKIKKIMEESKK